MLRLESCIVALVMLNKDVSNASSGVATSGTVVAYTRFLEIRQRRQRVIAELARLAADTGHPPGTESGEPPAIEVACSTGRTTKIDSQL